MLKNRWVLVGLALILGGFFIIDYTTQILYPSVELVTVDVPEDLGGAHVYNVYKDTLLVGTYNYSVLKATDGAQDDVYGMSSGTSVTYEDKSITLESLYRFDQGFRPISYRLNVTEGDDVTYLMCDFSLGEVTTKVGFQGETVDTMIEIEEGTLLVENSMPGYWEVLLQSASLERGNRYTLDVFIPQAAQVYKVTLFVERDLKQVQVEGRTLECTVVDASELGLTFYIHLGELVQYLDDAQGVVMNKVR